jgi:hypothetical protein
MRTYLFILCLVSSASVFAQKLPWIPFNWEGDSLSGKYFDKLAITIPVTLDKLPYKLNMQLDLGATVTVIYGNSIQPYLEATSALKNKIDTTLTFRIQSQTNPKFKNIALQLGKISFGNRNIGYFKGFGDAIAKDSIHTATEKYIGTIAPDLFQDKILIIDYPNKRICVVNSLPKQYAKASFRPYKIKEGRIKIPFTMQGKDEDVMFDTGSSLFALISTKENAASISNSTIVDSLKISSWGDYYMVYGCAINTPIRFGEKQLNPASVYYDTQKGSANFYKEENIWGITGNAYFLKNVVIIDYKNKRFGVQ